MAANSAGETKNGRILSVTSRSQDLKFLKDVIVVFSPSTPILPSPSESPALRNVLVSPSVRALAEAEKFCRNSLERTITEKGEWVLQIICTEIDLWIFVYQVYFFSVYFIFFHTEFKDFEEFIFQNISKNLTLVVSFCLVLGDLVFLNELYSI